MKKEFLLDMEMSLEDIWKSGYEIRLLDGSVRLVEGKHCLHQVTGLKRSLSEVYDSIRNVKNKNGDIIAKRLNLRSKLLYMSSAFKPFRKKVEAPVSVVSYKKKEIPQRRKKYSEFKKVGECVPVSINLKELIFNDKEVVKKELIGAGAKSVHFYESSKGTLVVVEPIHIADNFKIR